jgi:broad specificity phosphatase PhoE
VLPYLRRVVEEEGEGLEAARLHGVDAVLAVVKLEDGLVAVVAHGGVVVHLEALQVLHQAALQVACAPGARQGRTSVGSRRHRASPAS